MKILIAYDGSKYGNVIVDDLSRAGLPPDAETLLLSVLDSETSAGREPIEGLLEETTLRIQQLFPQWDVKMETAWGSPATFILERAHSWGVDLLIAATHGSSTVRRLVLGSVSSALVQRAGCSVRVVRTGFPNRTGPMRLVIGHDGSRQSAAVVDEICRRRWRPNTEAFVLTVVAPLTPNDEDVSSMPGTPALGRRDLRNMLEKSAQDLRGAGVVATSAVREGDPSDVLVREAEERQADAIFVGDRGLGRLESILLGSVSSRVVHKAHCSVEVIR